MNNAEDRFDHNLSLAAKHYPTLQFYKHKSDSHTQLMTLCANGMQNYFDFVYVDGSHEAPDVLLDALLAHKLTKVGGIIAFDDYLWSPMPPGEQQNHYLLVKPAVDHYVNTYQRKVHVIQSLPIYQLYVQKLSN